MKKDLFTVIVAAVIGFSIAYFLTNLLYQGTNGFSFKVLGSDASYNITAPDPEIFNFRSVNPTVEVYVGQCKEYNEIGECVDSVTETDLSDSLTGEEDLEQDSTTSDTDEPAADDSTPATNTEEEASDGNTN